MIECPDDIEVGKSFRIPSWLWVVDYSRNNGVNLMNKHGIGDSCSEGKIEEALIINEVADNEVAAFINKEMTEGYGGVNPSTNINRCFVCELVKAGAGGGTGAGKGYKFFISYGGIVNLLRKYNPLLEEKLKNIKLVM